MEKYYNSAGYETDGKRGPLTHRRVCRESHGDWPGGWHVHHVNGKKNDNRPENLIALPSALHVFVHEVFGFYDLLPGRAFVHGWAESWEEDPSGTKRQIRKFRERQRRGRKLRPLKEIMKDKTKPAFRPAFIVRGSTGERRLG